MLSLRKAIDDQNALESAVSSYRAVLVAVSDAGARAVPPAGEDLKASLLNLEQRLRESASATLLVETERDVEAALGQWSDHAAKAYNEKNAEVKEVLLLLATAAGQMGERDQRYTRQFQEVTSRLQAAAQVDDIATMRRAVGESVTALNSCVASMARDGQDAVSLMRSRLAAYEARLEEVERLASIDQLTGLSNRRKLERGMDLRVLQARPSASSISTSTGSKASTILSATWLAMSC